MKRPRPTKELMSYYDLPVLLGRGFSFGFSDEVFHGIDKNGEEWQVLINGEYLTFGKFYLNKKIGWKLVTTHKNMDRDTFNKLFEDK